MCWIENVKIYNEDKIICASVMWVRSVDVLCALLPFKLDGAGLKKSNEMQQYADIYLLLN